ncbi:MAG TPA: citrate synthase [Chloroflexia bacterium]|nr:citrate synthase [Chloroflexia bacterium]
MSVEKLDKSVTQTAESAKADKGSKGLEGVVALESSISSIIGSELTYRGITIDELAENASYEEVVYLLWYGKLPNRKELDEFNSQLRSSASLPPQVLEQLKSYPTDVHPMDLLRTAVSALALYDPDTADMSKEANSRKAIRLTAQIPIIVTAIGRLREGKEPVAPRNDLSVAANFVYMLNGEEPDEVAVKAIDTALVLHADHELNASTFSARSTVSTLADMHSGIVSAIGTLKGPLHGGANEAVMRMLLKIGSMDNVDQFIDDALNNKQKIMGFGHRVYKNGDPRAKFLKKMSKALGELKGETKWYEMSTRIDDVVVREKGLLPNVDFYSASVYYSLGIPIELFTPVFATSRISGWLAHIMEQYADNRLIRPRAEYVGPVDQHYIPIDERS